MANNRSHARQSRATAALVFAMLVCSGRETAAVECTSGEASRESAVPQATLSGQGERIRKLIVEGKLAGADDLLRSMAEDDSEKRPLQLLWVASAVKPMGSSADAWGQVVRLGIEEGTLGDHCNRLKAVCKETREQYSALIAESLIEALAKRVGETCGIMLADEALYRLPQPGDFPQTMSGDEMMRIGQELRDESPQSLAIIGPKFITYRVDKPRDPLAIPYGTMVDVTAFHCMSNNIRNNREAAEAFASMGGMGSEVWIGLEAAARDFGNGFGHWGAGAGVLMLASEFAEIAGGHTSESPHAGSVQDRLLEAGRYPSVLGMKLLMSSPDGSGTSVAMEAIELILEHAWARGDDSSIDRALIAVSMSAQINSGRATTYPLVVSKGAYIWSDEAKSDPRFARLSTMLKEASAKRPQVAKALFIANP